MLDYPKIEDLYSIAQRALKAVGRESESCTAQPWWKISAL